ncbi:MAG: hypothetical protein BWY83_00791 [bacterium ADurb.Bin478]|nr:MAG: hypothetical protein BWY83_00791 [bacterium ADurb.Bin478]
MLTIILAFLAATLTWSGVYYGFEGRHWGWATLAGFAGFIAVALPITWLIRKRMEMIFNAVQGKIISSQEQLRRKILALQNKMQSGPKFQAQIEKEQADSIREAIRMLDELKPIQKWNLLVLRQYNTFKGQMLFQIKDFEEAAPLMYKKGDVKKLEKAFYKGTGRFKDEKGTLLYALYSWVLVAENRISEAVAILDEGRKKCESEVLQQNWDHLVNGRTKRFSNAALGEQWYALYLENPPQQKMKAQTAFGGKISRGGFR